MSHCEKLFKLAVWRVLRVQVGHGWTHGGLLAALCQQQQQKCGEVGSAVFHAPPVWHKPVSPLLCLPGCIMFFMADRLAATRVLETKMDWLKGQDRRKGKERERERGGKRERGREGKGWRCWTGFPGFPLPRIPSQSSGLCQPEACPGTFLNTDFTSLRVPTAPPHLPPPASSLPAQTMNKRACLQAAEKRAARSRGETLPGDSCQQQQGAGFCVQSGRKAGNWPSFYLPCIWSADRGAFIASSSYASLSSLTESIKKLQPRLLGPPVNITSERG